MLSRFQLGGDGRFPPGLLVYGNFRFGRGRFNSQIIYRLVYGEPGDEGPEPDEPAPVPIVEVYVIAHLFGDPALLFRGYPPGHKPPSQRPVSDHDSINEGNGVVSDLHGLAQSRTGKNVLVLPRSNLKKVELPLSSQEIFEECGHIQGELFVPVKFHHKILGVCFCFIISPFRHNYKEAILLL